MLPSKQNHVTGIFRPAIIAWVGVATVVTFELSVWFLRSSEPERWENAPRLTLSLPSAAMPVSLINAESSEDRQIVYRFQEAPERLEGGAEQLAFTEGLCGSFIPGGELTNQSPLIDLFYFEYAPGNSRFIHDVYGHAPEVCMRSMGATLKRAHPDRFAEVESHKIPVRVLEFATPQSNSPLWVFKLTWVPEDAPYQPDGVETSLRKEKIQAGLLANPRPPARVILVGARNYPDEPSAWKAFSDLIVTNLSIGLAGS